MKSEKSYSLAAYKIPTPHEGLKVIFSTTCIDINKEKGQKHAQNHYVCAVLYAFLMKKFARTDKNDLLCSRF